MGSPKSEPTSTKQPKQCSLTEGGVEGKGNSGRSTCSFFGSGSSSLLSDYSLIDVPWPPSCFFLPSFYPWKTLPCHADQCTARSRCWCSRIDLFIFAITDASLEVHRVLRTHTHTHTHTRIARISDYAPHGPHSCMRETCVLATGFAEKHQTQFINNVWFNSALFCSHEWYKIL